PVVVLSSTINFATTRYVLAVADGRYFPAYTNGIAVVAIRIDGSESFSNHSEIDFRTTDAVQHSFNSLAAANLGPGSHTFELVAYNHPSTPSAYFWVGTTSGLAVLTDPAPNMLVSATTADSPIMHIRPQGYSSSSPDVPMNPLLIQTVNTGSPTPVPVVSLASGTS